MSNSEKTPNTTLLDEIFMRQALYIAHHGLGRVWPNPTVGAVIVKSGHVLAMAHTADGGRPHAETQALQQINYKATGATLYVTLEPCSHKGRTPPCVEAIVKSNISRVVIACRDPDKRVSGSGVETLKAANIEVVENICADQAIAINCGFFSTLQRNRPWITMKIASSKDGYIASKPGHCTNITGSIARRHGHLLRYRNDAIMTGIGTILADDPLLTCRLPALQQYSPIRIVLEGKRTIPRNAKLFADNTTAIWRYNNTTPLKAILQDIANRGITRLMIEAGHGINSALLQQGLVDEIYWYRSPTNIGASGLPAFSGNTPGLCNENLLLELAPSTEIERKQQLGADELTIYKITKPHIIHQMAYLPNN